MPTVSRERRDPSKTSTSVSQIAPGAASRRSANPAETGSSAPKIRAGSGWRLRGGSTETFVGFGPSHSISVRRWARGDEDWAVNRAGSTLPLPSIRPLACPSKE